MLTFCDVNIFDMAAIKKEHYFYPGHKSKTGKICPGILFIDGKYKFRYNQTNKDQTIYKMYCVQQANPEFSCRAKATVVKRDDDSFFLYSCVDLDLLITLDKAEIKDSLKEIGVKRFGDRHKLCERILVEKRSRSDRTPDDNQKQDTVVNDEPSLVEANHLDQSKGPFENTESLLVNDDDTFGNIEETEHESEHID